MNPRMTRTLFAAAKYGERASPMAPSFLIFLGKATNRRAIAQAKKRKAQIGLYCGLDSDKPRDKPVTVVA